MCVERAGNSVLARLTRTTDPDRVKGILETDTSGPPPTGCAATSGLAVDYRLTARWPFRRPIAPRLRRAARWMVCQRDLQTVR